MDFDRYGIEEWNNTRPQQLAQGYSNAVADTTWLRELVMKLVGWQKRRRQADGGTELHTVVQSKS